MDQADRAARRDREPEGASRKPSKYAIGRRRARQRGPQGRVARPAYFGFVQWELPGRLGPEPGRYVVRRYAGDAAQHVRRDRRPGGAAAAALRRPPRAHGRARRDAGRGDARDGDRRRRARREARRRVARRGAGEAVDGAFAVLNRALHAHRIATADPFARRGRARATRSSRAIGYGAGEQVADGRWSTARELPAPALAVAARRRRCGRRSGSRRCWPRATWRWPASCSRCAPARTSTTSARARRRCSSRRRSAGAASELESWRDLPGMAGAARGAARARAGGRRRGHGGPRGRARRGPAPPSRTRSAGSRRPSAPVLRASRSDPARGAHGRAPCGSAGSLRGGSGVVSAPHRRGHDSSTNVDPEPL